MGAGADGVGVGVGAQCRALVGCGSFFIPLFVVALTYLASSVQYPNLVLIALLLHQPFLDER